MDADRTTKEVRCDVCGAVEQPGATWWRWLAGEEAHGFRRACRTCHDRVKAASERVLAATRRLSLEAAEELGRRLEQGPPPRRPFEGLDGESPAPLLETYREILDAHKAKVDAIIADAEKWRAHEKAQALREKHPSAPDRCPDCEWSNTGLMNYGKVGDSMWLCHGCAAWRIQRDDARQKAQELRKHAVREAWSGSHSGLTEAERLEAEAAGVLKAADIGPDGTTDDELIVALQKKAIGYLRSLRAANAELDDLHRQVQDSDLKLAAIGAHFSRSAARLDLDLDSIAKTLGAVELDRTGRTNEDTERNLGKLIQERTELQRELASVTAERDRMAEMFVGPPPVVLDKASVRECAGVMLDCARAWEPGARLIGNLRADAVARVAVAAMGKSPGYPVGFDDGMCDAVCALNLACEDEEARLSELPIKIAAAIGKVREVAFPLCQGCSEASGSGLAVRHYPPLCRTSEESRRRDKEMEARAAGGAFAEVFNAWGRRTFGDSFPAIGVPSSRESSRDEDPAARCGAMYRGPDGELDGFPCVREPGHDEPHEDENRDRWRERPKKFITLGHGEDVKIDTKMPDQ